MKTLYQATDGTVFNTYLECEQYERNYTEPNGYITHSFLYDSDGELITKENLYSRMDDIWYVDIRTEEDSNWIYENLYEKMNCTLPYEVGKWYYDEIIDDGSWHEYDVLAETYKNVTQIFSQEGEG